MNERIIKKYPNRRLYDTAISSYITLEDIKNLVLEGSAFQVIDAKTQEDLTNSVLLQIITELESKGSPIFTKEWLQSLIRFYGHSTQGLMANYLEQSMQFFTKATQGQLGMETAAIHQLADATQKSLDWWQKMQAQWLEQLNPSK
jgi:polyhydroxyalkanoate synthesis repressor PhaR